jgi:hypothetical protein
MIVLTTEIKKLIENFHLESYHAGINTAFSEVVGAGCKKLALSSPYDHSFAKKMLKPTKLSAKNYDVLIEVEDDLLKTRLFPESIAEGKIVFLIAQNIEVLEEYHKLKALKISSNLRGNPVDLENEIALRFGELLSYSSEKIKELINKNN